MSQGEALDPQKVRRRNGFTAVESDPVLDIARRGDTTTVVVGGDVDLFSVVALRERLEEECERRPSRLVIDLSAVELLDSSGMQVLLETHRRLTDDGSTLVLESPSSPVSRLLGISGLDELFAVNHAGSNGSGPRA